MGCLSNTFFRLFVSRERLNRGKNCGSSEVNGRTRLLSSSGKGSKTLQVPSVLGCSGEGIAQGCFRTSTLCSASTRLQFPVTQTLFLSCFCPIHYKWLHTENENNYILLSKKGCYWHGNEVIMLLKVVSKNKITSRYTDILAALRPGSCLNANSLTAWFGLVSKQTWPHQDNSKGLAGLQGPKFQLPSGQGEAKRPEALHGQGSPPNTHGTARLRDLCSITRCYQRSGPTSCPTSMTYSLSPL